MTVSVSLKTPIFDGPLTILELHLREPELRDILAGDSAAGETSRAAAILASMCDVSIETFGRIKMDDFAAVMAEGEPMLTKVFPNLNKPTVH